MSGDVVAKSVLTQYEAQLNTLRTQLAAAEAAAKEATQALEAAPEAAEEKVEAFESKALKAESERSAAEAALAQCVREYAKERAQKARLQQQISALQKRLLQVHDGTRLGRSGQPAHGPHLLLTPLLPPSLFSRLRSPNCRTPCSSAAARSTRRHPRPSPPPPLRTIC